jgi:hypothetical protein
MKSDERSNGIHSVSWPVLGANQRTRERIEIRSILNGMNSVLRELAQKLASGDEGANNRLARNGFSPLLAIFVVGQWAGGLTGNK